jgi:hypothetical protein
MQKRLALSLFTLALILCALSLPSRSFAGTYVTFNVPQAEGAAVPTGINKWGTVTGWYTTLSGSDYGFLYQLSSGDVTTFAVGAKVSSTYAMGINDSGWVVGYFQNSTGWHGFLRNPKYTQLDAPGAGTGVYQGTYALSINDANEISGVYFDSNSVEHGFIRDASGDYTTFSVPGGANVISAVLNQGGEVAGTYTVETSVSAPYGYVMDAAGNITTFAVADSEETYVSGINSSGQITGYYDLVGNPGLQPYYRDEYGNITTFSVTGYLWNAGIEDSGNMVGIYVAGGTDKGWQITSAGALTYFKDPSAGPEGTYSSCVSGDGKIAGYYWDSEGNVHNFVEHN